MSHSSIAFEFIVIGGGSGGVAAARRAAKLYGKKVALVEAHRMGGTCVNLGCVPKKIMYNAAILKDTWKDAGYYAFENTGDWKPNWTELVRKREAYIQRLNGIYETNLINDGVAIFKGFASFISKNKIAIDKGTTLEAKHILIATGSHAIVPDIPGKELGITSDGFFALRSLPSKIGIIGSGYVGVELAGILYSLGSDVTLWCRREGVLSHFDPMISDTLTTEMRKQGITINSMANVINLQRSATGLTVCFQQEDYTKECHGYDCIIWAIGRAPNISDLNLENAGIGIKQKEGSISTDKYQNTNVEGVYAVGDVCGPTPLTPVAIAASRKLVDRLFGNNLEAHLDYNLIPTVVFSHPSPCGAIGLTEPEARSRYPKIRIFESSFTNLYYALNDPEHKFTTRYKLICEGDQEKIVGLHMIGRSTDEILQGFATAIKMGATKADFDNCVAIHPTAAEELVTMK